MGGIEIMRFGKELQRDKEDEKICRMYEIKKEIWDYM